MRRRDFIAGLGGGGGRPAVARQVLQVNPWLSSRAWPRKVPMTVFSNGQEVSRA
jgi:hypothetical protein